MLRKKLLAGLLCTVVFLTGSIAATKAQQAAGKTPARKTSGESAGEPLPDGPSSALQRRGRYKLCRSDVMELNFAFTPEFNQTVTVQPDGYITLRGAGTIRVEGQTLAEVTQSVRKAYANILHEPQISVELRDFEKPFFIVGGEVGRPGKFDLRGDTTVVEAVAIAGGFRDSAKHSEVLLFHRVPDGWVKVRKMNVKKILKQGDLNEVAYLQPGDFLYVPKNTFSKIAPFIPSSSIGAYVNPFQGR